jgi:hypothetical protein
MEVQNSQVYSTLRYGEPLEPSPWYSYPALFVCRHLGKLLHPRNPPLFPALKTMGLPHLIQVSVVVLEIDLVIFDGSGFQQQDSIPG